MAEQHALQQRLRDGAAVLTHEGAVGALAVDMDRPGHQLLARAALALDHHRKVCLGDPVHQPEQLHHARRLADDVAVVVLQRQGLLARPQLLTHPVQLRLLVLHLLLELQVEALDLLLPAAVLCQQAGVLDGDGGLICQVQHKLGLALGEHPLAQAVIHVDGPHGAPLDHQGHRQHRAQPQVAHRQRLGEAPVLGGVHGDHRLGGARRLLGDGEAQGHLAAARGHLQGALIDVARHLDLEAPVRLGQQQEAALGLGEIDDRVDDVVQQLRQAMFGVEPLVDGQQPTHRGARRGWRVALGGALVRLAAGGRVRALPLHQRRPDLRQLPGVGIVLHGGVVHLGGLLHDLLPCVACVPGRRPGSRGVRRGRQVAGQHRRGPPQVLVVPLVLQGGAVTRQHLGGLRRRRGAVRRQRQASPGHGQGAGLVRRVQRVEQGPPLPRVARLTQGLGPGHDAQLRLPAGVQLLEQRGGLLVARLRLTRAAAATQQVSLQRQRVAPHPLAAQAPGHLPGALHLPGGVVQVSQQEQQVGQVAQARSQLGGVRQPAQVPGGAAEHAQGRGRAATLQLHRAEVRQQAGLGVPVAGPRGQVHGGLVVLPRQRQIAGGERHHAPQVVKPRQQVGRLVGA